MKINDDYVTLECAKLLQKWKYNRGTNLYFLKDENKYCEVCDGQNLPYPLHVMNSVPIPHKSDVILWLRKEKLVNFYISYSINNVLYDLGGKPFTWGYHFMQRNKDGMPLLWEESIALVKEVGEENCYFNDYDDAFDFGLFHLLKNDEIMNAKNKNE